MNNTLTKYFDDVFYLLCHLSSTIIRNNHLKTIFQKKVFRIYSLTSQIIPKLNQKKNTFPKSEFYQFFRNQCPILARFIGCSINAFDCRPLEYFRDPVSVNFDGARFYSLRYAVCEWTGDPCHPPSIRAV